MARFRRHRVAFGAASVVNANISTASGAPFINGINSLPYLPLTGGTVNGQVKVNSNTLPGFALQATAGNAATVSVAGNGNALGATDLLLQQNASNNSIVKNNANGSLALGTNGANNVTIAPNGAITVLAADTVARGVSLCKFKAADTSKSANTTLANDPDLTYALPAAGTYAIEVLIPLVTDVTSAAGGIKWNLNFSGTYSATRSFIATLGFANGAQIFFGHGVQPLPASSGNSQATLDSGSGLEGPDY